MGARAWEHNSTQGVSKNGSKDSDHVVLGAMDPPPPIHKTLSYPLAPLLLLTLKAQRRDLNFIRSPKFCSQCSLSTQLQCRLGQ